MAQALESLSSANLAVRELLCLPGTLGGLLVGIARRKLGKREGEEGSARMADKRAESDGCHCEKPTGRVLLIRESLTSLSPSSVGWRSGWWSACWQRTCKIPSAGINGHGLESRSGAFKRDRRAKQLLVLLVYRKL